MLPKLTLPVWLKTLFVLVFAANTLFAQNKTLDAAIPVTVQSTNYYLLTLLQRDAAAKQLIERDPELARLITAKLMTIRRAPAICKDAQCLTESLKFTNAEISAVTNRLSALYQPDNALGQMVSGQLIPSGTYSLYANPDPKEILLKAWQQDAAGINHTLAVYAQGQKPNYPAIDSISLNIYDKDYNDLATKALEKILYDTHNTRQFFMGPLTAALLFLQLSGRDEAASYEPMETTVNKAALQRAEAMKWSRYPYTVILVPGEGPEEADVPLSPGGMLRCRLAAEAYKKSAAPFIMVSGGNVHPYKTLYNEAEEMKRYLMYSLSIPEGAILMEPHARHTTTNMRNAVRLLYKYHFPVDKAAIVVTDKGQSTSISNMAARCIKELLYVPYRLGKRLSDTAQEFFAVKEALQINAMEPLDP